MTFTNKLNVHEQLMQTGGQGLTPALPVAPGFAWLTQHSTEAKQNVAAKNETGYQPKTINQSQNFNLKTMKTIFKSLLLAAFIGGIATSANAQTGAQTTMTANARILKQITFVNNDNVQFGIVAAGGGQTFLNPQSQSGSVNVGFSSAPGRLIIDATSLQPIRVEFDTLVRMLNGNPTPDTIGYRPIISGVLGNKTINATDRTASTLLNSTAMAEGDLIVTNAGGTGAGPVAIITTSSTGSAGGDLERSTLYVGGYLYQWNTTSAIPSGGPTGTFTGTLNFNVLYAL